LAREPRHAKIDHTYRRRDGGVLHARVTASPVWDADGQLVYWLGIVEDFTERRSLEEQPPHAQKMDAVGRPAGGVAHDFNNLLTVIAGFNRRILSRLAPDDPLRVEAGEIARAAERGAELTSQLLAFSRRDPLEPRVVDLNILVGDMERLLRRLIGEDI